MHHNTILKDTLFLSAVAMTRQVKTLFSWDTEFSADSAEFCPVEPHQDILAVGTYQLADPDGPEGADTTSLPKKRLGRLYLKQLRDKSLVLLQQIDMPAILDLKWCCHTVQGNILLAVANAIGQILVYKLEDDGEIGPQLVFWCQHDTDMDDTLALSLDWSTRKNNSDAPLIATSDSKGKISIIQLVNQELRLQQKLLAHEYEAWITSFNYWNDNIVYTGGDDGKFRCFDVREDPARPVFTNRTQHSAGVTSIHASTKSEFRVASGSYDECVCLWDTRRTKYPTCDLNLGGGVWRLKWEPGPENLLLAACMHNGCHVVDTSGSALEKVASFTGHQSLAYGADWWWDALGGSDRMVASASFYDHLLCLWEFSIN